MLTAQSETISNQLRYQHLLRSYLFDGGEDPLNSAYELGRECLAGGTGLLELTCTHDDALSAVMEGHPEREVLLLRLAANRFLQEVLSPFEISRLSSQGNNETQHQLHDVLDEEAKRIALRLHDEAAQMLATVYLELAEISHGSSDVVSRQIGQVVGHLDEVCEQLRGLSHELHPVVLEQLGLIPALQSLASGFSKRSGLAVTVTGDTSGRLAKAIETALYRAVQEGLANVARHAKATLVEIRVWFEDGKVACCVGDNGIGIDLDKDLAASQGLGLLGIQERARALKGKFGIVSTPGVGTTMQVVIPI